MNNSRSLIKVLLTVLTLSGCSDPAKDPAQGQAPDGDGGAAGAGSMAGAPNVDAEDLLERARALGYRDWARAPGYDERRKSVGPHSAEVDIYVNQVVVDALGQSELTEWPEGSFIVKDAFENDQQMLTALMLKQADGWAWAEYSGSDDKYLGPVEVCTNCHKAGSDFVRAFELP